MMMTELLVVMMTGTRMLTEMMLVSDDRHC